MKDLPPQLLTVEALREFLSKYGDIQSVSIKTSNDLTYGFCNFHLHDEAENAVHDLNETELEEKVVYVGRAQSKKERQIFLRDNFEKRKRIRFNETRRRNLYVRGFDATYTEDDLKQVFGQFGEIESLIIIREPTPPHESKKFGFICFTSEESAQKCLKLSVSDYLKTEEGKPIFVAYAQKREDRNKQLLAVHAKQNPAGPKAAGPVPADLLDSSLITADWLPALRNFKVELATRIGQECNQNEAVHLIDRLKKLSNDQIKLMVKKDDNDLEAEQIWNQWKEKALFD